MFNGINQTEKNENNIILFYKTSRIGKSLETERKTKVTRNRDKKM